MNNLLFRRIDNSALIVFRIIFGLLCFLESVGAIFTGWIKRTLVDPEFTFSFIGLDWLQPLPGSGMYFYYVIMGVFGLGIMLGYRYRFSAFMFTVMWAGVYFMQKASYNNHYYLLVVLGVIMAIQPANRYLSLDVKRNPSIQNISMPQWSAWVFILQMFIVYTYGSIAKIYPDWLDTSVMEILMKSKANYWLVGDLLQQKWVHYFLAYGGILFDGLVIPLLLIRKTRKWAFFASIFFHVFNSIVFQVGIFPYLSLAFCLFFFEPKTIHSIFLKSKPFYNSDEVIVPKLANAFVLVLAVHFVVQLALPLRHHFIEDDVLWTEEGHRMSWRMMLRTKNGFGSYQIVNHTKDSAFYVKLHDYVSVKQRKMLFTKPDVIWQFSQRLKSEYQAKGDSISVYLKRNKVVVNGKDKKPFVNPDIDLAAVKWDPFKHSEWLYPSK
ncbi:HTTM domain-containing protein [Mangrovimonas aestuarii]|uniref:HTTM domain-containing protein n=1 Tax=Mangrovimonas aestuarii TaxID=3018443 RepID=UPI00237A02AB|nr:HTTM domain-containing protein [Mangrovimonas aestuarii]